MKLQGILAIIVAALIPLTWYAPMIGQGMNPSDVIGQYLGVVALILMGITQLIATRIRGIETIFGSLDRAYILHKWLAVGALISAFLHEELGSDLKGVTLVRNLADLAEEVGEISYNGLIVLIIASLITFIPYKWWKWSHRFIGVFFSLAAFHFIFIQKPYATFDLPGLYTTAFCAMGVLSYLYLLIPRAFGHNSKTYKVKSVIQHGATTEVNLQADGKGIKHKAGQFSFLSFDSGNLKEVHPFTISQAPQPNGDLRFLIKGLGDYTNQLGSKLSAGATARVSKGYGHFTLKSTKGAQVWVAGGIGITPFLAWANALPSDWETPTKLYYCVRTKKDAVLVEELQKTADIVPNFSYEIISSSQGHRLSSEQIATDLGQSISNAHVYFCGPTSMRDQLKNGLVKHGLANRRFHFEAFEMRTGIGIVPLVRKLFK